MQGEGPPPPPPAAAATHEAAPQQEQQEREQQQQQAAFLAFHQAQAVAAAEAAAALAVAQGGAGGNSGAAPAAPAGAAAPAPRPPSSSAAAVVAPAPLVLPLPAQQHGAAASALDRDAALAAALNAANAGRPRRAAAAARTSFAENAAAAADDDEEGKAAAAGIGGRRRSSAGGGGGTAADTPAKKRGRPRKVTGDGGGGGGGSSATARAPTAKRKAAAGPKAPTAKRKGPRKTVSVINANGTRSGRRISKRELAEGESDDDGDDGNGPDDDDDADGDGFLDDDDEYGARAAAASARRAVDLIPAFAGEPGAPFPLSELDDEVERVLGHRPLSAEALAELDAAAEAEAVAAAEAAAADAAAAAESAHAEAVAAAEEAGLPPPPPPEQHRPALPHFVPPSKGGDRWACVEFRVKWRRYSYLHTSWDTRATLSQLPGFKRVLNYCKRVEELEAARPGMTREQQEYADVQLAMEEEEVEEASRVERIIKAAPLSDYAAAAGGASNEDGEGGGGGEENPTNSTRKLLVKWRGLPYAECTWEFDGEVLGAEGGREAVEEFEARERRLKEERTLSVDEARARFFSTAALGEGPSTSSAAGPSTSSAAGGAAAAATTTAAGGGGNAGRAMVVQPGYLQRGTLRDYQLQGLNWLVYSWSRNENCILADEMGLGKTVQCVSMLGYLRDELLIGGPFLVVVPLSTVPNWAHELKKWLPSANSVVYVGDTKSREVIRRFEFGEAFADVAIGGSGGGGAGGGGGGRGRKKAAAGTSSSSARRSTLRPPRTTRFDVLVTTYELVLKDAALLSRVRWNYLCVDEAHRLKNSEAALYKGLSSMKFANKLLVTGTPLQNSLRELWALLHFLDPVKFPDSAEFEKEYEVKEAEQVLKLHEQLRPHLLRRVIKDVEKSLPPKNERILRVGMTPLQKRYYRWILTRNFRDLNRGARGGAQVSLLNIITELKKCCNHPFLFESAEAEYRLKAGAAAAAKTAGARAEAEARLAAARAAAAEAAVSGAGGAALAAARQAERDAEAALAAVDAEAALEAQREEADRLVLTSGKMVLLDKLLKRLKETGHRVLIFSQMVRVLDIIADYAKLRGFLYQRLDGSTPAAARHQAMDHFNAPDSRDFVFLLSTRAGGLGINLATADTVIIFDSDWNPQNDFQAMSRAHRIGQKDTVNIYRFLTSGSCEEDILQRAKRKMVLDHLVIQRMDTSGGRGTGKQSSAAASEKGASDAHHAASAKAILAGAHAAENNTKEFSKDELAAILRFGAEEIFKEDDAAREAGQQQLVEEDIDAILARAEVIDTSKLGAASAATADSAACAELLNSFNVANFEDKVAEDDAAFWDRIVSKDERPAEAFAGAAAGAGGPELGPDGKPVELGVRAARLKALDAEMVYRELGGGGGGGGGGSKKTAFGRLRASSATPSDDEFGGFGAGRASGGGGSGFGNPGGFTRRRTFATSTAGPGPPLADASLRVDGWPAPCGSLDESLPRPRGWPDTMSRRDAGLFVRTARRFALPHRLADMTAEVGESFERKYPLEARQALLVGLKNACLEAARRGGADANLDWFGATVKAADVGGHLVRMVSLHEELMKLGGEEGGRLESDFRVDFIGDEVDCPLPKWAAGAGWTTVDDAMLLIGIWRHGMQRWAAIASDERLGLKDKLAQAAQEKLAKEPHNAPGLEHLPRGTHLETRVAGLLKRMVRARASMEAKAAREAERERKAAARAAGGGGGEGAGPSSAAVPPREQQPPPPPVPPLDPAEISLSDSLQRSVDAVAALRATPGEGGGEEALNRALRQLGAQVKTRASSATAASPRGAGEAGIWALVAIKIAAAAAGGGVPEQKGWTGPELQAKVNALFEEGAAGCCFVAGGGAGGGATTAAAAAGAPAASPPVLPAAAKREDSPAAAAAPSAAAPAAAAPSAAAAAPSAAAPAAAAPSAAAPAAVPEVEMEEAKEEEAKKEEVAPAPEEAPMVEEKEEAAPPAPAAAAASPAAPPATTDAVVMAPVSAAPDAAATAPAATAEEAAAATPLPPPQAADADDNNNNA